jgi:hypothetical protein
MHNACLLLWKRPGGNLDSTNTQLRKKRHPILKSQSYLHTYTVCKRGLRVMNLAPSGELPCLMMIGMSKQGVKRENAYDSKVLKLMAQRH